MKIHSIRPLVPKLSKNKFARNQCTPLAPTLYPFNDNCAQTIYLPQVKSSTRRTRVCAGTTARNQNSFHSAISTKIVYTNLWAQPMQFLGATASGYDSQCNSLLQLLSLVIHLLKKKKQPTNQTKNDHGFVRPLVQKVSIQKTNLRATNTITWHHCLGI